MTDAKSTTTTPPLNEKTTSEKVCDSVKSAGKTVSDKSKVAATKVSDGAKSAALNPR